MGKDNYKTIMKFLNENHKDKKAIKIVNKIKGDKKGLDNLLFCAKALDNKV